MNTAIHRPLFFHAFVALLLIVFLLPGGARAAGDDQPIYNLQADGLACPFCAYGIEKQLKRIDGVNSIITDVKSGLVIITMNAGTSMDEADARRAVKAAGFTMRDFKRKAPHK